MKMGDLVSILGKCAALMAFSCTTTNNYYTTTLSGSAAGGVASEGIMAGNGGISSEAQAGSSGAMGIGQSGNASAGSENAGASNEPSLNCYSVSNFKTICAKEDHLCDGPYQVPDISGWKKADMPDFRFCCGQDVITLKRTQYVNRNGIEPNEIADTLTLPEDGFTIAYMLGEMHGTSPVYTATLVDFNLEGKLSLLLTNDLNRLGYPCSQELAARVADDP